MAERKGLRTSLRLALLAPALIMASGCSSPASLPAGPRIFFSDDLRIHSVRPDGTAPKEFGGKPTSCPIASRSGELFCASYRGPYFLVDPLRPGIYRMNPSGGGRHKLVDWPALPVLCGFAADGRIVFFQPDGPMEIRLLNPGTGALGAVALPARPVVAAVSPDGKRAAVALSPHLGTVVLGNQAWFTEGADLVLVPLGGGEPAPLAYPPLPGDPPLSPSLEHYAGAGVSALAWRSDHELAVSSSPGVWSLDPGRSGTSSLIRLRAPGQPLADGLAFSPDGRHLAITSGGRLLVRDLDTGAERDVTPRGLVGGAHHPAWMQAAGGR